MSMNISSTAFTADAAIPPKFTGDGADASPPLKWTDLPAETKELALIVDDPDAPMAEPFVHWVMYKIPPQAAGLPEAVPPDKLVKSPPGAAQGKNSFRKIGYGGPAPPRGHGTHHYHFHLYALDKPLEVQPGLDNKALLSAMAGHILDEAETVGTYQR